MSCRLIPFVLGALLVASLVGVGEQARADAIVVSQAARSSTIAEFFVERDGVRVEVEIGLGDVGPFRNLLPDELYTRLGFGDRPLAERLEEFFASDLVLAPEGGEPLPGSVVSLGPQKRVLRDLVTGEPLPATGEEETVLHAVLQYRWEERPQSLALSSPRRGGPVNIGFVAYHGGVPVNDFRYMPPASVLDLDWEDSWYSAFRTRSLRRQLFSPFHGFLYVEPYEVRKEIILRPRDLQRWTDLGIAGADTIPADSQPEMLRAIAEFLRGRHKVVIDGEAIEPELLRVNFLRRTLKASTVVDPPEDLPAASATVGVIFAYPVPGMPKGATMEWDLFDERVQSVPAASVDAAGPLPVQLSADDPVLVWTNYLKFDPMPQRAVVSAPPAAVERAAHWLRWWLVGAGAICIVLAVRGRDAWRVPVMGAALCAVLAVGAFWAGRVAVVDDARASDVVGGLLHNVYRSFDFRDEEKVYDLLAESVHGDLLTETYVETRRSLEVRNQGGARVKVKELGVIEIDAEPDGDGFRARTRWTVGGSVGHWGHVHQRTNGYLAEVLVRPVDGVWKLVRLDVLEEERL